MDGEDDDDEDDDDEDEDDEDEDDDDDYDTKVWKPFFSLTRNITSTPFPASEYVLTFFFPFLFGTEDQGNCWRGRAARGTTCRVQAAVRCCTSNIGRHWLWSN